MKIVLDKGERERERGGVGGGGDGWHITMVFKNDIWLIGY